MKNQDKVDCIEEILGSKARLKILKTLAFNEELNITQIITNTKLNHSLVLKHLNALKLQDIVQEKCFGRIKIFRYRIENFKAKSLKNLFEIWQNDR